MTDAAPAFTWTLSDKALQLKRTRLKILQINTGLKCNQKCRHCHLDAGPDKTQLMDRSTMDQVIDFQSRCRIETVDITGGAPELNTELYYLIENIAPLSPTTMLRSNLSALYDQDDDHLLSCLKEHHVTIVSSFPALNASQTDSQRGKGIFDKSVQMLQKLNQEGYGRKGSGLALNLVANPAGAFLPSAQQALEERYRKILKQKFGIVFNSAFVFANMPLGRFKDWLRSTGNYAAYMEQLVRRFNPCTLDGLMCKSLISVSWDGLIYDCDFNLAADLPPAAGDLHISDISSCDFEGRRITVGDHCYACTAGSGFT